MGNNMKEIENAIEVLSNGKNALFEVKLLLEALDEAKRAAKELNELLSEIPSLSQSLQKES